MNLKSDEPAYYLMALSLARDFDLRCDVEDIRRLGEEYPYNLVNNLILMSGDGWKSVYFGKPFLVSLVAAPATALFGSGGFVATNMALLMWSVWLGALYLRQWNSESLALLFSAGFFVFSNAFVYVFWMHTEVLCIAAVTASLYLGLTDPGTVQWRGLGRLVERVWNARTRPAFSAAALAVAAYNKPVLVLLGLPALVALWRNRRWSALGSWFAGFAASSVLFCSISLALTPTASAYLGVERQGVRVESFDRMPELPAPELEHSQAGARNSWKWIFRPPEIDARLPPNLVYFLIGRHTGLFPYAPFTLISLGLFFGFSRRSPVRWVLLGALVSVALFFLTMIPYNWHGGGGFVGNRYFVNAIPGFLFLVTRIAPDWLPVVASALAGLFVVPVVFSPYGAAVPSPTLQAHTRNSSFALLPFESTLAGMIPGYRGYGGAQGTHFFARSDLYRPVGDALWIVGGKKVSLTLKAAAPLARPVFQVESVASVNRIRLALGGDVGEVSLGTADAPARVARLVLAPGRPRARRAHEAGEYWKYTLLVEAENQAWHSEVVQTRNRKARQQLAASAAGDDDGRLVPNWEEQELQMLVGTIVTYLGEEAALGWDVYRIEWLDAPNPGRLVAGSTVRFRGSVRNASRHIWRSRGATRVSIGYHWRLADGSTVEWNGLRTLLPGDVPPGAVVDLDFEIMAPRKPGGYVLELDGVQEQVAWFSQRNADSVLRRNVEVVAHP